MYTGTITKNSDGTYTSSYGHQVTKGWGGELHIGGAPIGMRDIGMGVGFSPRSPFQSPEIGFSPKPAYSPTPAYAPTGTYGATPAPYYQSAGTAALLGAPIYLWMLILAAFAYAAISAPASFMRLGLHLHPIYGVLAFFMTFWLYRQLMTFLPTALVLALPSALISGAIAWSLSDNASFRHIVAITERKLGAFPKGVWPFVRDQVAPSLNAWTIAAVAVCLVVHTAYWRYRHANRRTNGWVFARGPLDTARDLFILTLISGAIGWLIALRG